MNTAEIFRYAPKYIAERFYAINGYVWKALFPQQQLSERLNKFKTESDKKKELARLKEIAGEASLIVLIVVLRRYFIEGTEAAKNAVDTFKEFGIEGFRIGSKFFSERNEFVMQGASLAQKLEDAIGDPELRQFIINAKYPYEVINKYKDIINRG